MERVRYRRAISVRPRQAVHACDAFQGSKALAPPWTASPPRSEPLRLVVAIELLVGTVVMTQADKHRRFRALHERPDAFVMPNPWDAGTARILTALGFEALATTSAGFAFAIGRRDSAASLTRDEVLRNAQAIVEATSLPF